jgi:hypothetical protein
MDSSAEENSSQPARRLVIGNALEWVMQPERRRLPGSKPPVGGLPYPDDDMALFWSGDNKVVMTRHRLNRLHVDDCREILDYKNVHCATPGPAGFSNSICADLADDDQSLGELADLLGDGPALVEAYGATPEYARLIATLRARSGGPIRDCMTPREYLALLPWLDSKIRVREFFAAAPIPRSSPVRLTRAFTVRTGSELDHYVRSALAVLGPIMIKADFGFGGHAMDVIDDIAALSDQIKAFLRPGYGSEFLIEEYIGSGDQFLPLCYTGMVTHEGETATSSVGRELQYSTRYYAGAYIGADSMPTDYAGPVRIAGEAVGQVISRFGYRGSFTLDMLCRKDDASIFLLEINPRQALPSTLGDICIQLFGRDYGRTVSAVARRRVPVHPSISSYPWLRDFLAARDLFGRTAEDLIVLPYLVNSLAESSIVGLAVAGKDSSVIDAALSDITRYLAEGRSN